MAPSLIAPAEKILLEFAKRCQNEAMVAIGREEIVAHATLSALQHHWPSLAGERIRALLVETKNIRSTENSRWMIQRRIAISKLQRVLEFTP